MYPINMCISQLVSELCQWCTSIHKRWACINAHKFTLCKSKLGNEYHVMMECESDQLRALRVKYLNEIIQICHTLGNLSDKQKFMYIMNCHDIDLTQSTCKWISECNKCF